MSPRLVILYVVPAILGALIAFSFASTCEPSLWVHYAAHWKGPAIVAGIGGFYPVFVGIRRLLDWLKRSGLIDATHLKRLIDDLLTLVHAAAVAACTFLIVFSLLLAFNVNRFVFSVDYPRPDRIERVVERFSVTGRANSMQLARR